ncbi:MAG: trypsin-like peptidase domain-containing protein [Deltaproteobacteria bacterium]|nr:trypsin-like peptidase domain-containing protein [Deltaproteobacteria bacterium]
MPYRICIMSLLLIPQLSFAAPQHLWSERPTGSKYLGSKPPPDFAALADQLVPAVVSIQVEHKVMARTQKLPYEFFFGPDVPREYRNKGIGSGFFISQDGLILTNYHVVENADLIEVTYASKDGIEKTLTGKVLGTAPAYDVALIQAAKIKNAPVAFLGNSDSVRIGQWVVAIGNPFGLSHSVSVGIISAKERRDIAPSGRVGLYDFLQTDASINPGNSGGPLINAQGEVIGINSAVNSAGAGIGFAIPINMVKAMLPDLKNKGKFVRSWMGIRIQPLSTELAESYGLTQTMGALVADVKPNGPAGNAGIKVGDIILAFADEQVKTASDLPLLASMAGIDKPISIKIWRNKQEITLTMKLSEFPTNEERIAEGSSEAGDGLGLIVSDITAELRREFHLEQVSGVVVKTVDAASPAERAGLMAGDIINGINGQNISRARELKNYVDNTKSGDLLRFLIQRKELQQFIAIHKP